MRVKHRTPVADWFATPVSDPVDPAYEAEVQHATNRAEREYRQAQERLARAEKRLASARAKLTARKQIRVLERLVAERKAELGRYRDLMTSPPVVIEDRQLRQRTGTDDHLELGIYKRPRSTTRQSARR